MQLQPDNVKRALAALETLGYQPMVPVLAQQFADPEIRKSWIQDKGMVVFQLYSEQHSETPIDLFVSEPFDFDAEYERALRGEIAPGVHVRFVSLETLLQMKETANRDKDRDDIRKLTLLQREQK